MFGDFPDENLKNTMLLLPVSNRNEKYKEQSVSLGGAL